MELNQENREALLIKLEEALAKKESIKYCMENAPDIYHYNQIEEFLCIQNIAIIKKALTDNEIDY